MPSELPDRSGHRRSVVRRATRFAAPPHEVFLAVNDPATAPLIDPACDLWEPDTDPVGVGTRFTIRGRLGRIPIRGESEVVTWTPPHRAVFRSVRPTWPLRMTAEHRFDTSPDGGTDYTWSIEFVEVSRVARPVVAVARRLFSRAMGEQAAALARYLDAQRRR